MLAFPKNANDNIVERCIQVHPCYLAGSPAISRVFLFPKIKAKSSVRGQMCPPVSGSSIHIPKAHMSSFSPALGVFRCRQSSGTLSENSEIIHKKQVCNGCRDGRKDRGSHGGTCFSLPKIKQKLRWPSFPQEALSRTVQ